MGDGSTGPGAGGTPGSGPALTIPRGLLVRALVWAIRLATRWVHRLAGESGRNDLSGDELRDLVAHSRTLNREERRLIGDVLEAGDRHVRELMVPRTEVAFLDADMSVAEAVGVVRTTRHSRFPVRGATADDVIGFVHMRDLLLRPQEEAEATVGALARPLRELPASKLALPALSEMRRAGDHLALVVDEYGGTAGIVTLEDLLEELVGEIHDEKDAAPEAGVVDGVVPAEVDGLLNLNDFADRTGIELLAGPYDTVGGFVMAALGRLPEVGDEVVVAIPTGSWRLLVVGLDGRRIARVALVQDAPKPGAVPVPAPASVSTPELVS